MLTVMIRLRCAFAQGLELQFMVTLSLGLELGLEVRVSDKG